MVYCSFTGEDLRWQFVGQAFIVLRSPCCCSKPSKTVTGKEQQAPTRYLGVDLPPANHCERAEWCGLYAHDDIGTLYTLIAGVLNMFGDFTLAADWYKRNRKEKSGDKKVKTHDELPPHYLFSAGPDAISGWEQILYLIPLVYAQPCLRGDTA